MWEKGYTFIAGIDEVGRGPLAGPVVAGAVILRPFTYIDKLKDSKKLTPGKREEFFALIVNNCIDWAVGIVEAREIERINILQASKLAMQQAIKNLRQKPDFLLIDAVKLTSETPSKSIIRGDEISASIACASIIAKVMRDRLMDNLSLIFPQYGFEKHKGYPTKFHREKIAEHGLTPIHRKTFKFKK
ncbi:MAG: ribonuclease HII [Caldiserica bacterium]|nr:ribonuclease HII [Caldisericota bacterium]